MIMLAQLNHGASEPELRVGILAVAVLFCFGVWAFQRWLRKAPTHPDPWDETVTAEMENEEATPLCHRCLTPHDAAAEFCPTCGVCVGQYTNWLPYPYLFSMGHTLRIGTNGDFRRSPLTIVGFLIFGAVEYALLAPIYWFMFLRKLFEDHQPEAPAEQPPR